MGTRQEPSPWAGLGLVGKPMGGFCVEVRINGLIVIFLELSFTGAGCLIYILFPIPAIRFSHRDTRQHMFCRCLVRQASTRYTNHHLPLSHFFPSSFPLLSYFVKCYYIGCLSSSVPERNRRYRYL
jgi:hypothetical protein